MKQFFIRITILFFIFTQQQLFAQCPNNNILTSGNLTPPGVSLSTMQTFLSGQYMLANVVAGANYTVSTCSSSAFDSQLTIYNDVTGAFVAYNDDFCGVSSSLSFTPSFCGNVRVLLDKYFCTTGTSSMDVTMTMNTAGAGIPSLTSSPDVQACNGGTTTIGTSNNGSGGSPPYVFSWLPITNLSTPTTSSSLATVTATQNYTLTLVDANGCMANDTVLVTMLPALTVNFGPDTTLCGGPVLLDAGNIGSTYLWSTGAGTQTISPSSSGTYSVVVQSPLGCVGSDVINIIINPNPSVSIGPDTSSCSASVILNAGPGYLTYNWSIGGNLQNDTAIITGPVSVIVTDANGCSATDTIIVTLSPATTVNLGPDIVQCGGPALLNAGNPGSLYFWSNSSSSQTASVNSSGAYNVLVISPAGCSGSDTIVVTINNQPTVNLGPDTSICVASLILDAGNFGSTYLWSTLSTSQTIIASGGTYFVAVTDPSGCTGFDTVVVISNSSPTVSAGLDVTICINQSTTLTATGGVTYVWSTGATTPSIIVSPTTSTTYYVTGYDANGCAASALVSVTVLPLTTALFSGSLSGVTETFLNQSTNATSYSWDFGDSSPLNNSANPSYSYSNNGSYTVTLTATGPCGSDTYTMVVIISQVGLQDNDLSNTLSLLPNPNDGNFTLAFDFSTAKDVTVRIIDVSGRVVYQDQQIKSINYKKQIVIESAEPGMYFVQIITADGVVNQKVLVQR